MSRGHFIRKIVILIGIGIAVLVVALVWHSAGTLHTMVPGVGNTAAAGAVPEPVFQRVFGLVSSLLIGA